MIDNVLAAGTRCMAHVYFQTLDRFAFPR